MAKAKRRPTASAASRLPQPLKLTIAAALDKKAVDVVVLDFRKAPSFTDFFVICTGGNVRQAQAIADGIKEALGANGLKPALTEGYQHGQWILADYFDFVVHVFNPATRMFYDLERLWGDAKRVEIAPGLTAS